MVMPEHDEALLVGVGLQRGHVDPAERERDEGEGGDGPGEAPPPRGQAGPVIRSGHVVGRGARLPAPLARRDPEHQQEQRDDVGHRRAEPAEVGQEVGEDVAAVAGDEVGDDAEQEATDERDRDRVQASEHDRRQGAQHDEGDRGLLEREQRRDQHASESREDHGEDPRHRGAPRRVDAPQLRQLVAVDDGTHLEPDAGATEHEPQDDRGQHRARSGPRAGRC